MAEIRRSICVVAGKLVGKCPDLTIIQVVDELRCAEVCGPCAAKSCIHNWRLVCRVDIGECLSATKREVRLCLFEFGQESILEDIHLIRIDLHPLMHRAVAVVPYLEGSRPPQFTLNGEIPRLRVRLPDIRIQTTDRGPVAASNPC